MLVFVSMCPGDLACASVHGLAAIESPPYYYVINAFHSFIFLQTVQEKMSSHGDNFECHLVPSLTCIR